VGWVRVLERALGLGLPRDRGRTAGLGLEQEVAAGERVLPSPT
jgi:hypothetical protein